MKEVIYNLYNFMPKVDNSTFYQSAIKKYGISARGVHWASVQNQHKRFEVLVSFLKDIKKSSIVDAGCGFGDLYLYLNKGLLLPQKYIGIDVEAKMVQIAKYRTQQDIFQKDILVDILPLADYYIASGSMNVLTPIECLDFIYKAFSSSTKGFVFNMLHIDSVTNTHIYTGFEPNDIVEYCLTFTDKLSIKDDYLDGDFTIFLQK